MHICFSLHSSLCRVNSAQIISISFTEGLSCALYNTVILLWMDRDDAITEKTCSLVNTNNTATSVELGCSSYTLIILTINFLSVHTPHRRTFDKMFSFYEFSGNNLHGHMHVAPNLIIVS